MLKNEFSIDNQEDEDLRCPICNYYFSEITKPFLLPCNHNLCIKCIDCVVEKKMLNCPICRKNFKEEDKKNFQVNFAFLNLVIKILKTKVIFCKKCSKIFNWVDHYSACDQRDFIETNEMIEQIKKLAEESYMILKSIDKHSNVLAKSKRSIFESTHDILKIINNNFFENFEKTLQHFFSNVPVLNYNMYVGDLKKFLELCRPLDSNLNKAIDEVCTNTEGSEGCHVSDDEIDRRRTKAKSRNRDGYVSFNRETPNLSLSVNRLPSQSTKKNKLINSSTNLNINENFSVKSQIGDMLVNNFRQGRLIHSTYTNNPTRKFSVDNNYLMRNKMRKNLPIEEEDDDDNLTLQRSNRINRKNSSIDEMKESNTIKVDYFGKTNFTKSNNLNRMTDRDREVFNVREIKDDEVNYNNFHINEEERYFGRNIDANYDVDINENFTKNRIYNFNKDSDLSPHRSMINVPKQIDSRLNINVINSSKNHYEAADFNEIYSPNNRNVGEENFYNVRIPAANTNIMNLNYNFNLNQIFNGNEGAVEKIKNSAKKKIIVKNNEVKIVNVNCNVISESLKDESYPESRNYNRDNQKEMTDVSKSFEFKNLDQETIKKNFKNLAETNTNIKFQTGFDGKIGNKTNKKETEIKKSNCKNSTPTPQNPHETINNILSEFNKSRDIVDKILNYTKQIEFTTETIQNQISTNFNHLQENITKNINSLCDNITVGFSQNNKQYLINFIENTKKIWVFDVRKMKPELKEFEFLKIKFNSSMSMDFDDNDLIFISGGKVYSSSLFESDYTFTNNFVILRWSSRTVELSGQMPRKRAFHSSISCKGKYFVIGGLTITLVPNPLNSQSNQVVNVRECECYDWLEKRWELMPSMNAARCNPSLCIYNGTYLYAFRGWVNSNTNECNFLDTIEFININNISIGWTMFKPEDPGMCWMPSSNSTATVIGENKILICGGISNWINSSGNSSYGNNSGGSQENKFLNNTFIFDPIRKTVFRSIDMIKASSFNSVGTVHEKNMIVIDNKNEIGKPFGAHVYDIENNMWRFSQV